VDDVGYIIEEVFRGHSVLEPFHASRLTLVKWRKEKAPSWGNVICLTKAEANIHEKRVLQGGENVEDVYPMELVSRVSELWKQETQMRGIRWGEMYSD